MSDEYSAQWARANTRNNPVLKQNDNIATARQITFGERALSITNAAKLDLFGLSVDTVAEIANLIVLVQQQAWEEGHDAGGKACLDRFEQKFGELLTPTGEITVRGWWLPTHDEPSEP